MLHSLIHFPFATWLSSLPCAIHQVFYFLGGHLCFQASPSISTAGETATSQIWQQIWLFVFPSFCLPSLALLQLPPQPVCIAAWLAEGLLLSTFLPSFPKKTSLSQVPFYFFLIHVSLTTVFSSHYHLLFTSTVHNRFY